LIKKEFFLRKKTCHECAQDTHFLFNTSRFGSVCRSCYKKELNYLNELLADLIDNSENKVGVSNKDMKFYAKKVDRVLEVIKVVWERVFPYYRGDDTTEFQTIYKNLTKNESKTECSDLTIF
jgi:hypothetical protein